MKKGGERPRFSPHRNDEYHCLRPQWFPLVLACLAVGGCGMLLYFATTNTLIQTSVSDEMRGRVMGIWALVFGGMTPVGGLE